MRKLIFAGLLVALTGCNVTIHTTPNAIRTTPPVEVIGTEVDPAPLFDAIKGSPIVVQEWDSSFLPTMYAYRETLTIDGVGNWNLIRNYTKRFPSEREVVATGNIGYRGVQSIVDEAFEEVTYSGTRFIDLATQFDRSTYDYAFRTITLNLNRGAIRIEDPGSEEYPSETFDYFAEAIARETVELPYDEEW